MSTTRWPRLAKALAERRAERKWELVPEGGEGEPGTQWSTLLNTEHSTRPCRCGGTQRVLNATQRIDVGINRGTHMPLSTAKCDTCGVGMSSNYQRV
jgi:hypothetical protein